MLFRPYSSASQIETHTHIQLTLESLQVYAMETVSEREPLVLLNKDPPLQVEGVVDGSSLCLRVAQHEGNAGSTGGYVCFFLLHKGYISDVKSSW
jgi:hypothetical protein